MVLSGCIVELAVPLTEELIAELWQAFTGTPYSLEPVSHVRGSGRRTARER